MGLLKKISSICLLLAAAPGLACAASPPSQKEAVKKLKIGMTTKEVAGVLGHPASVKITEELGIAVWTYTGAVCVKGEPSCQVTFGADKTLTDQQDVAARYLDLVGR